VLNGESADTLVVTARTKGGQRDTTGIGVFLVPGNAKGVSKKGYPTVDSGPPSRRPPPRTSRCGRRRPPARSAPGPFSAIADRGLSPTSTPVR